MTLACQVCTSSVTVRSSRSMSTVTWPRTFSQVSFRDCLRISKPFEYRSCNDKISGGMEKVSECKEGQNRWESILVWISGAAWDLASAASFWSLRINVLTRRESRMSRNMTSHAWSAASPNRSFRSSRTRI